MRRTITMVLLVTLFAAPLLAKSIVLKAPGNCNDIAAAGWIPAARGEQATLVATWKQASKPIIGVVVCESGAGTVLEFGAHLGTTRGGWVIQAGTGGAACLVGVCSGTSGTVSVTINLITGVEENSFRKSTDTDRRASTGALVRVRKPPAAVLEAAKKKYVFLEKSLE